MTKRIRTALAALLVALTIAFSAGAFGGFSQADVAGTKPPKGGPLAGGVVKLGLAMAIVKSPGTGSYLP